MAQLVRGIAALLTLLASSAQASTIPPVRSSHNDPQCLRALVSMAAEAIPSSSSFEPAPCDPKELASIFRYDRALRVTRVAQAVHAGQIVPRYAEFGTARVEPGDVLTLVVQSGPVTIERRVEALQPAAAGQSLFVQSEDGRIFSAVYAESAP